MGCDVCGFGTVEDVDKFNPLKPCPDCGVVMIKPEDIACLTPREVDRLRLREFAKKADEEG